MATFNSAEYVLQRAAGSWPSSQVDASVGAVGNFFSRIDDSRKTEAGLEFTDFIYTISAGATEANTDVINLGYVPIGCIIYPEHCFAFRETSPGTTLTLGVGDSLSATRYAASMVLGGAAGTVNFTTSTANVGGVTTRFQVTSATNLIFATISAATSALSAGAKIHFKLAFKALQP